MEVWTDLMRKQMRGNASTKLLRAMAEPVAELFGASFSARLEYIWWVRRRQLILHSCFFSLSPINRFSSSQPEKEWLINGHHFVKYIGTKIIGVHLKDKLPDFIVWWPNRHTFLPGVQKKTENLRDCYLPCSCEVIHKSPNVSFYVGFTAIIQEGLTVRAQLLGNQLTRRTKFEGVLLSNRNTV